MILDGAILNRPRIWLAGLQLFAANPSGVELVLSWSMFAVFVGFGVWLCAGVLRRHHRGRPTGGVVVLAGVAVLGLRLVPVGDAP